MSAWHSITAIDASKELGTDIGLGLSEDDSASRVLKYGRNELKEKRRRSLFSMFFSQFADFMVMILIIAALVAFFLGEAKDAIVIIAIVSMNAVLGVVQEERAGRAIAALRKLTVPKVMVKRAGFVRKISSTELVPGDIILLEAGGLVGADARIIESANLRTNESSLTGESAPVDKSSDPINIPDLPVADMKNMVFMGTPVVYGRGEAIVISTGMGTQIGKIAEMVQEDMEIKTPLQKRLNVFGKWLGILCLGVCFIVFIASVIRGGAIFDAFLTAVSLAVAAIPEGLPAVTTISLALGAYRMAKKGAIIRKLPAVETLGSVSVICSDKTGTLTQNRMTVNQIYLDNKLISVTGTGYQPSGKFFDGKTEISPLENEHITRLISAAALCNDAYLEHFKETNTFEIIGDPTEGALIVLAGKAGLTRQDLESKFPRTGEIPFDPKRKLMTTIHRSSDNEYIVYVKGAPDELLKLCHGADRSGILKENEKLASGGLRTLGVAYKVIKGKIDLAHVEKDLTFIGIIGMIDPPRPEAKEAVALCKQAGIEPVMITGDHRLTALAIAKELGIEEVFARVSPEQKLNIVEEYQASGKVVAVTGDGVNDAPALKRADIGVAMGITGTDVAKEASDMVLSDDNFATIVAAVREGRGIFENIRKFIWYLLSANTGEIFTMFFAILLNFPLPLLPIQILWVNLVTDGFPALALSAEPIEKDIMKKPPRKRDEGIMNREMLNSMMVIGIIMAAVTLFLFSLGMRDSLAKGRTFAFSALAILEMYHVFNCKSEKASVFSVGIFSNIYLVLSVVLTVVLQLLVIYNPVFQKIFNTVSLSGMELFYLFALSSAPLVYMEIKKAVFKT
jgi:Ca2+-transporting ATPase